MSRSESKRTLKVSSDDSAVRITILNHLLEPVAEGLQDVEVRLAPGLYEARFSAGSSVRERLVTLDPGREPMVVHQEPIAFASAAPLLHTRAEVPEQSKAAARLSMTAHRRIGQRAKLLVFIRDQDLRARTNPARGLTLHRGKQEIGAIYDDGEAGGGSDDDHPPWAACSYELEPGSWQLRCAIPGLGAVEQAVVVCEGWQTQVFLLRRSAPSGRGRWPDLADASVLMASMHEGFQPGLVELRGTELARQGLRDRQIAVPRRDLHAMVYGKQENPMLAIYGAHLMIQEEEPDRVFIKRVTNNLRKLVGDHPDVRALELWHSPDAEVGDFADPPMLMSSWAIVVAATAERPELVPRGSLSAKISQQILSTGPWLRWRATLPASRSEDPDDEPMPLGEALAGVADALPDDQEMVMRVAGKGPPVEWEVISYARQTGEQAAKVSDAEVIDRLGVPRTVAEDAVEAVLDRLEAGTAP
jgi:hypothetical protein